MTRRMSSNMGINQQDFIEAFMVALEDDRVVNKLQGGMFQQLQKEIHHLTGIIQQKNERIAALDANQCILERAVMRLSSTLDATLFECLASKNSQTRTQFKWHLLSATFVLRLALQ